MPQTDSAGSADAATVKQGRSKSLGGLTQLPFDCLFATLLLGFVIWRALYAVPVIIGSAPNTPLVLVLVSALLPTGTVVLLSCLERVLPAAGPRKSARTWFLHLHIHIFNTFLVGIAVALTTAGLRAIAHRFGFQLGLIDLRFAGCKGLPVTAAAVWVSAVTGDFFVYWFHRALHQSNVLWQLHKMHHMDEELEAITLNRQNWIEVFIAALPISAPMTIIFKFDNLDPTQLGLAAGLFVTAFNMFLTIGHMNVRLQVGRASVLFCSPQIHRIHHSRLPHHRDKNFAFVFPVWDVLFGTYYVPSWDEFPPTGVDGEREIKSFWEAEIFTQREWSRMFRAWRVRRRSPFGI